MIAVISSIDEFVALTAQGHCRFVCTTMEPVIYARTVVMQQDIQVDYVSHFVHREVLQEIVQGLIPHTKQLMYEFDDMLTTFIEQHNNFRVSAFASAFGYNLLSVVSIFEVWRRLLQTLGEQFSRVLVVDSVLTTWLPTSTIAEILTSTAPKNIEFISIGTLHRNRAISLSTRLHNIKTILWLCRHNIKVIKDFIGKDRKAEEPHNDVWDIVLFEPLGELEAFRYDVFSTATSYSSLRQDYASSQRSEMPSLDTLDAQLRQLVSSSSPSISLGFLRVWEFAKQLLPMYVSEAKWFSELIENSNVKVGIFGTAPILPNSNYPLLANVLCQQGRESVSLQHGGYDGDTIMPGFEDRFHVEFTTSTYITYGYNQEDHTRCYPLSHSVNIQPGGSNRLHTMVKAKAKIDILYVPNNYSGLDQKVDGLLDSELVISQLDIISYLNVCKRPSLVKIRNAKNYTSSFLPVLEKTAKHVRFVWGIDATNLLAYVAPKAILYEEASSTFLQSLQLDCEIFSLNRLFFSFEPVAYDMLQKRVHFFDSVEEMVCAVEEFFEGKREPKRDNSYVQHYLRGAKELHDAVRTVLDSAGCVLPKPEIHTVKKAVAKS